MRKLNNYSISLDSVHEAMIWCLMTKETTTKDLEKNQRSKKGVTSVMMIRLSQEMKEAENQSTVMTMITKEAKKQVRRRTGGGKGRPVTAVVTMIKREEGGGIKEREGGVPAAVMTMGK